MTVPRANRTRKHPPTRDPAITDHDIEVLEATLKEDDTTGRSLLQEIRAGKTHSEAEIAAIHRVSLNAEPAAQ